MQRALGFKKFVRKQLLHKGATALLFAVLFMILGVSALLLSRAATSSLSNEIENGTITGAARSGSDPSASGGKYIQFMRGNLFGFATGAEIVSSSDAELDQDFQMMKDLGATWVRLTFPWDVVEGSKGSFRWTRTDRIRDKARELNLRLIVTLNRLPNWQSAAPNNYGCGSTPNPNFSFNDFSDYARAVVQRYKDDIKVWELGNEPNHTKGMWDDPADPNACQYVKMIRQAYTTIKSVDPNATVLSGGIGGIKDNAVDISGPVFLRQMYAENGNRSTGLFDALSYHPYSYPKKPSEDLPGSDGCQAPPRSRGWCYMVHDVRNTMIAAGDSEKKVWLTEFGSPGIPNRLGTCSYIVDGLTTTLQAEILRDVLAESAKPQNSWIGPVMWFNHRDKGIVCPSATDESAKDNFFGLVEHNWTPSGSTGPFLNKKPSFDLLKNRAE
jgi:polysaccharide biosynthesis protein PslG